MADLWMRIHDPVDGEQLVCLVEEAVIGRDFRCDVVVHDDEASRMHARVTPLGGQHWQLADLATTNGTYINSERIVGPAEIAIGDIIRVGRISCTIVAPPN
jgi:pSer/pThr/pTyr-binding forkhead associated (FHA) protein